MKKIIQLLTVFALFLSALCLPAQAADRITKTIVTCKYPITSITTDTFLTQSNGVGYCDISNMIPERITIEHNVTSLTGTNVIFKVLTTSDPANSGATTDPPLLGSDGSTALVSATVTATGRGSKGTSVPVTGTSGVGMNLGTKVGVWADVTSISALDGYVILTIFGRQ